MRIAAFNSFPFHYEMYYFIIHYCAANNFELHIFTSSQNNHGWLDFYRNHMHFTNFFPHEFFNPNLFEKIILLTDDDHGYKYGNWHKLICIDHFHLIRNHSPTMRITTRPFPNRDSSQLYTLPVAPLLNLSDKKYSKHILCLGISNTQHITLSYLQNRFTNFDELTFHLVNRRIYSKPDSPNVFTYQSINALELINLATISSYFFIGDWSVDHYDKAITGALPLALSTYCKIIIPERMNNYYGFKNVIEYSSDSKITIEDFDSMEFFSQANDELETQIKIRNNALNKFLL